MSAATVDPPRTLQAFTLDDLAQFTREGSFYPRDSSDYRVLYVGRDDVHGALAYVLSRCTRSLKLNMFGYDDDALDAIIRGLIDNEHVFVQGTLDKSQSGGVHERKILAAWDPEVRASFAIGQSATHQISHTKGGVIDGVLAWEGSTNWSTSGEGTGIVLTPEQYREHHAGMVSAGKKSGLTVEAAQAHADMVLARHEPPGFKAQNNTCMFHVNPVEVTKFSEELDEEHAVALQQQIASEAKAAA
jgi:hypothetical protein